MTFYAARPSAVATATVLTGARRIGTTLVLEGTGPEPRVLLRCDYCGDVCAAGVDEAAARLNLEATGGAVVEGLDYCPGCDVAAEANAVVGR